MDINRYLVIEEEEYRPYRVYSFGEEHLQNKNISELFKKLEQLHENRNYYVIDLEFKKNIYTTYRKLNDIEDEFYLFNALTMTEPEFDQFFSNTISEREIQNKKDREERAARYEYARKHLDPITFRHWYGCTGIAGDIV